MITINKNLYAELKPYAVYMRQAYYSCCVMNISALKVAEIAKIAKKAGYNSSVNPSCSSCVIKLLSALGKEYFSYEQAMENKKKKSKIEEPIVEVIEKGEE